MSDITPKGRKEKKKKKNAADRRRISLPICNGHAGTCRRGAMHMCGGKFETEGHTKSGILQKPLDNRCNGRWTYAYVVLKWIRSCWRYQLECSRVNFNSVNLNNILKICWWRPHATSSTNESPAGGELNSTALKNHVMLTETKVRPLHR